MGIQQFISTLRKKKNSNIITTKQHIQNIKWDFLIFDVHCILYTIYNLLHNEINYFIRLIYWLQFLYNNDLQLFYHELFRYKPIILYIKKKHILYFNKLLVNSELYFDNLLKGIDFNNLLKYEFNNESLIIYILVEEAIKHIITISIHHISDVDCYNKTYIFFDGIPSKGKIKEQLSRRLPSDFLKIIKEDLLFKNHNCSEKIILNKLLNNNPPSISIYSDIVIQLKYNLSKINDDVKGKFYINTDDIYGEAEHQIMKYIEKNNNIFTNKKILLVSPDSDLILLSMINYTKNLFIDIYRDDFSKESNKDYYEIIDGNVISPFYRIYDYIFIKDIINSFELINNDQILDVSFILLFIGDDFLPSIPSLTSYYIDIIIQKYKKLQKKILYKLDNIFKINYDIFSQLLFELSINEDDREKNNISIYNRNINKSLSYISQLYEYKKNLYHLNYFHDFQNNENIFWTNLYLDNGSFYDYEKNYTVSLFENLDCISKNCKDDNQIINYLEGCEFILDLYINNNIKNYNWIYNFKTVPKLSEIFYFINSNIDNIDNIINYYKNLNSRYLNLENYEKYTLFMKQSLIINRLKIISTRSNMNFNINESNYKLYIKYLICYDKIKYIFDCKGKIYFNKCIDIELNDIPDIFLSC